jgi:branched-chain amino acid transport system ATP-binding protein
LVLERRREPSEGLAPRVVAGVGRDVSRLESEGMSIVLVEQNIELTLEPVGDIVILDWGSVVLRGAARNLGMNGAIVTQHQGVHWVSSRTSQRRSGTQGHGCSGSRIFRYREIPG